MQMDIPSVTIEDILEQTYTIIDVRTPAEYQEFHIPNAVNVPIFTNEERAEVGTIYTQQSQEKAKSRGIELVSSKLPDIYSLIKDLYEKHKQGIVIHCWRGGMRSRTVVSLMQ